MTIQEQIREGILHDFLLNGQYCVTFRKREVNTETLTFGCYPTRHKALLEIGIFENYETYKKLALY